jgi:hypothetical protein
MHFQFGRDFFEVSSLQSPDNEVLVGPKTDPKHGPAVTHVGTEATAVEKVSLSIYAKSAAISGITTSAVGHRRELDISPAAKPAAEGQAETQCPFCCRVIDGDLRGTEALQGTINGDGT